MEEMSSNKDKAAKVKLELLPYVPKSFFLYTCMQNPRLRTVYRQRKWPFLAPVRKIMALG